MHGITQAAAGRRIRCSGGGGSTVCVRCQARATPLRRLNTHCNHMNPSFPLLQLDDRPGGAGAALQRLPPPRRAGRSLRRAPPAGTPPLRAPTHRRPLPHSRLHRRRSGGLERRRRGANLGAWCQRACPPARPGTRSVGGGRGGGLARSLCPDLLPRPCLRHRGAARRRSEPGGAALLEVRAGNAPARALYGKQGFKEVGYRKRFYADGEDAVLLTRHHRDDGADDDALQRGLPVGGL